MAGEPAPHRTLTVTIPTSLADWLEQEVEAMRFASVSHGVARCVFVYQQMPPEVRETRY